MDTDAKPKTSCRTSGPALAQQHRHLVTAESCTGGWIAKTLTDIAGSSQWFVEGFVTYSNESKVQRLSVPRAVLEKKSASAKRRFVPWPRAHCVARKRRLRSQ